MEEDAKYLKKLLDYVEKRELDNEDIMEWYEHVVEDVYVERKDILKKHIRMIF